MRAAQHRGEGARELSLEPLGTRTTDRSEVDEVTAVPVELEPGANRQTAGSRVQLAQLPRGERLPRGHGVGEPVEQRAQLLVGLAG